jgi:4-amino-4-deoxy-L-arabinose transferase-like glycosyltransferase
VSPSNFTDTPGAEAPGWGPTLIRWACSPAGVFTIALAARVAWVLTLPNELIWVDEKQFAETARHIAAGDGYVSSSYRANPVVPTYLATFFHFFGDSLLYPRLGQAVIGALSCVLVQRLGAIIAGGAIGSVAALLVAFYPGHFYLSGVFYADCIAIFLAAAWLLTTYSTIDAARPRAISAAAGILFALVALTRATFLAVVPVAAAFFFLLPGARAAESLRRAAIFTAACAITIAPWSVRNYHTYGRTVIVSSGFWETLWKGNNELADGGPDDRFLDLLGHVWEERLAQLPDKRYDEIFAKYDTITSRYYYEVREHAPDAILAWDEVLKPVAIDLIVNDPGRFTKLFARKVVTLFSAFTSPGDSNIHTTSPLRLVASLYFYPLLVLAGAGVILGARDWRRYAPVVLLILAWAGIHGILTSCTRFRLPIDPFLFLLSATAILRLLGRRESRAA